MQFLILLVDHLIKFIYRFLNSKSTLCISGLGIDYLLSLTIHWKTTNQTLAEKPLPKSVSSVSILTIFLLPRKASTFVTLCSRFRFLTILNTSNNLNQEFLLFTDIKAYLAHCNCSLNSGCHSINPSTHSQEINCLVLLADCIFSMSCNFCIAFLNGLF